MKNLLFVLGFFTALFFVACEKDLITDVATNGDASYFSTERGGGGDSLSFETRCMRGDTVSADSLPQLALDYIAANYDLTAVSIQTVVRKHRGFAVELSDGTILLFNSLGEFRALCGDFQVGGHHPHDSTGTHHPHDSTGTHHPHDTTGTHQGCTSGTPLSVDSLSTAITDYVAANYADQTIAAAYAKRRITAVELSNGTFLLFRNDGTFVGVCGTNGGGGNSGGHGGGNGGGGNGGGGNGGGHGGGKHGG